MIKVRKKGGFFLGEDIVISLPVLCACAWKLEYLSKANMHAFSEIEKSLPSSLLWKAVISYFQPFPS